MTGTSRPNELFFCCRRSGNSENYNFVRVNAPNGQTKLEKFPQSVFRRSGNEQTRSLLKKVPGKNSENHTVYSCKSLKPLPHREKKKTSTPKSVDYLQNVHAVGTR